MLFYETQKLSTIGSRMSSVNLVVAVESVQTIIDHKGDDTNRLHIPSLIAVAAALGMVHSNYLSNLTHSLYPGVKFLLFLYCFGIRRSSSQVQILWEDHRNDLWINTFGTVYAYFGFSRSLNTSVVALLMSLGGSKLKWCMFFC